LRPGSSAIFVVEADEYDRSFLALTPQVAAVTNIEADHLDIYRDVADIRGAFAQFVQPAEWLIIAADDPGANSLPVSGSARVIRYGTGAPQAQLVARNIRMGASTGADSGPGNGQLGSTFDVLYEGARLGRLALRVPGLHNVHNALAAIGVGLAVGVSFPAMAPGLEKFQGVERRFDRLGEAAGVTVIDDYAHHPTEIRATLGAAREAFPGRRIVAAFQPHLFTRTRDFADEFGAALSVADEVFLTEIYPSRERPIPGITADLIDRAASRAGRSVSWRGERSALAVALAEAVQPGDVVLTMGAGDITRTGPELLQLLGTGLPARGSR
jgi:UDP-N-acetylmuramate--alanine ligase